MSLKLHAPCLAAAACVLLLAAPSRADRPSLIDMQATLDQLVDAFCNGDPAECGAAPPPASAVGTLTFDEGGPSELVLSLVELTVAIDKPISCTAFCVPVGTATFDDIRATVVQNAGTALLVPAVVNGTVTIADVALPAASKLLHFDGVVLTSLDSDSVPGRTVLGFSYSAIVFERLGSVSGWNRMTSTGTGCTVPNLEHHLELNGNSKTNQTFQEHASVHQLGLLPGGIQPSISLTRFPPDTCALRGAAAGDIYDEVVFNRLWSDNDAFAGRQSIETIRADDPLIDRWELRVRSGILEEAIDLVPAGGLLTTRSFDPTTGAETGSQSAPY